MSPTNELNLDLPSSNVKTGKFDIKWLNTKLDNLKMDMKIKIQEIFDEFKNKKNKLDKKLDQRSITQKEYNNEILKIDIAIEKLLFKHIKPKNVLIIFDDHVTALRKLSNKMDSDVN